jgi:hypothetical protein
MKSIEDLVTGRRPSMSSIGHINSAMGWRRRGAHRVGHVVDHPDGVRVTSGNGRGSQHRYSDWRRPAVLAMQPAKTKRSEGMIFR